MSGTPDLGLENGSTGVVRRWTLDGWQVEVDAFASRIFVQGKRDYSAHLNSHALFGVAEMQV